MMELTKRELLAGMIMANLYGGGFYSFGGKADKKNARVAVVAAEALLAELDSSPTTCK